MSRTLTGREVKRRTGGCKKRLVLFRFLEFLSQLTLVIIIPTNLLRVRTNRRQDEVRQQVVGLDLWYCWYLGSKG